MSADALSVLLQRFATRCFRSEALFPQGCIVQHFADWHSSRLQAVEKLDPDEDRRIVVAVSGLVPVSLREQPDLLVVADRVGRQPRTFRQFANLHRRLLLITTPDKLQVRVCSKSRSNFTRVSFAEEGRCSAFSVDHEAQYVSIR